MSTRFKIIAHFDCALDGIFPATDIFSAFFVNVFKRTVKNLFSVQDLNLHKGVTFLLVEYKNRQEDFGHWENKMAKQNSSSCIVHVRLTINYKNSSISVRGCANIFQLLQLACTAPEMIPTPK